MGDLKRAGKYFLPESGVIASTNCQRYCQGTLRVP